MRRLFKFRSKEDETLNDMRTAKAVTTLWKIKLFFLLEMLAERMWRALRWACDTKQHAWRYGMVKT